MTRQYLVVLAFAFGLLACQKVPETTQEKISPATVDEPNDQQLESAKQQVAQWHKEMLDKEAALIVLYNNKRNEELEVLAESISSQNGAPGNNATWKSDAYRSYLKCDTAWGKLGLYGGVLKMNAKNPSPSMDSIVDIQKREYEESKSACEQRLALPAREGYKQYLNS